MSEALEEIWIHTNGIRLHAVAAGAPDAPLIILLHGFPEFWRGWERQIAPLAQAGWRVVVPDQRGYNLSDKPTAIAEYSVDQLAADVLGILDAFGAQRAVIAGHDWGAVVAWYLAMHYPERVERLVIVNVPHPAAMNQALRKPVWRQLKKSLYIFYFQPPRLPEWALLKDNCAALARALQGTARPGTFSPDEMALYRAAWQQPGALTGGLNWYRAMSRASNHLRFARRVRVPTLILWGDQDAFLEPFLPDWSMQWVDDGRLLRFPEAGHWVLREESESVTQAMLEFLKES